MFLAFTAIFAIVFLLYNIETEAVLYAAGLCLLLAAAVLIPHFFRCRRKHEDRSLLRRDIRWKYEDLPKPANLAESDYEAMIRDLGRLLETAETEHAAERRESLDFYTTWVHQIKTPIAAMKMTLESEDTEQNRALMSELFRIEQYAEMVLSYLRLGSESTDYVFREHELDKIIREAVHRYAPQFVRRRIRLVYEGTDVRVLTDEKWLLFIIEQILSNSIKYTSEGGTVAITVTPDKLLRIEDTGIGIAAEDLPRIFEKGFTGYNGREHKKSTGLGLYLCKTAADRLGMKIAADSEPGIGTAILLALPNDALGVE